MSDRLAEIEQQLPSAGYWIDNARWLIAEVKRLREGIDKAHAALDYVGPLNEYECLALYELGRNGTYPEHVPMRYVQEQLSKEPWNTDDTP